MANITKFTIIRIIELALICIIIGLHAHSQLLTAEDSFLSSGTEVGFLIILSGLFAAAMMDMPVKRYVELGFVLVGFVLFIASGAKVINLWLGSLPAPRIFEDFFNIFAARGFISIIEGLLLSFDAYLLYKKEE